LDEWTAARQAHAQRYSELLLNVPGISLPKTSAHSEHVYHLFTIRIQGELSRRDRVQRTLASLGVFSGVYYPTPLHLQPVFAGNSQKLGTFPAAEHASAQVLSLPLFPELTQQQIDRVVESLATALKETA
jgi:dTDP-4-amino-4,6-dideoxygalactose transaminase